MSFYEEVADEAAQAGRDLTRSGLLGLNVVYVTSPAAAAQFFKTCKWTPKHHMYTLFFWLVCVQ